MPSLIFITQLPHSLLSPLQGPSVCFLWLRVSYGLSPSLILSCFIFPSFPLWSSVLFLKFHMSGIIWIFLWLISLSITFSSSIHVVANGKISRFFWWLNTPLCLYTTSSISIHSLMIIWALLYSGYCGHCCYKHWGACAPLNHYVCILWDKYLVM